MRARRAASLQTLRRRHQGRRSPPLPSPPVPRTARHRYGFAPKGASNVMFSSSALRHSMYTFVTEWTGGIYATPTILGRCGCNGCNGCNESLGR